AVLYEVLTGVPPFVGKNPIATIMKVQKDPVVPVRTLVPEAPPELAAVAARVTAYEYSSLQLLTRFIKKNKTVSIVSLVAFLAICGALVRTWQENVKA